MREVAYGMRDDEEHGGVAGAVAARSAWKLIAWIGGGTFFLLLLGFCIFAAVAVYLGGGMPGLKGAPQVGTAASRPTIWLNQPAIIHSSLPNVVIAAVMEHESQGQVFARNYNCSLFGLTSPIPCSQTFPGGLIKTQSEDAGLMQVNSANWKQYGLRADPFNPQKNIAAGVAILQADMQQYGYLEYALEAYNSGSGGPNSPDVAYAQAVLADINAYEAGPVMAVWSTAPPFTGGTAPPPLVPGPTVNYTVPSNSTSYWIIAEAAGPYGATPSYTWNVPPITITTKAGKVTTIPQKPVQLAGIPWAPQSTKCVTDKKGTATCTPQAPVMVAARALVGPATVIAKSPSGPQPGCPNCIPSVAPLRTDLSAAPFGGGPPVWPGAEAWYASQTGGQFWTVTAQWPGTHMQHSDFTNMDIIHFVSN